MNVLLLGSGGREHALAWKLALSPKLGRLFIAPGNAGTRLLGTNVPLALSDFPAIRQFALENKIGMVVPGPEDPLVKGIHDYFLDDPLLCKIPVIGPIRKAAMLEGSKEFAKKFMNKYSIPTAAYRAFNFDSLPDALDFISRKTPPYVLKADGLAAGKGVVICCEKENAVNELYAMLRDQKFGEASKRVVVEDFLKGIELSAFVITDGKSYKILPEAKDYKKIGEGDTGPNTGGMGAISPVSFANREFMNKVEERIIRPTIAGLVSEDISYHGFIFFGLMNVKGDPYMIEYNCRMGDPEAESVLPRIQNDLIELFMAVAEERLEKETILTDPRYAATVMLVSKGYPDHYEKGKKITIDTGISDSTLFHAGTAVGRDPEEIITNGGRVIAVTSMGSSQNEALERSYRNAGLISFEGKYCRRDIGFDL
jgi:phosphoribosylamine--glycine ligase